MEVQEVRFDMSMEPEGLADGADLEGEEKKESKAMLLIGWFSIGMAVAALSIFLGAELRSRYKFKRRTPYDFYSNAGEQQASEFGMGI